MADESIRLHENSLSSQSLKRDRDVKIRPDVSEEETPEPFDASQIDDAGKAPKRGKRAAQA